MKSWFLVPLLSVALLGPARGDDLNARAAQLKSQLQTSWLPSWAATSPANEGATQAAFVLETLSHAHRLGYSTPDLNLLDAARVHYKLLRDSRRDKVGDGFFEASGENNKPLKYTLIQARIVSALVEYARASGEGEPRGLAIKTWRLVRDGARDKVNGGYFDSFLGTPPGPTQARASGVKSGVPHLALLEAGTSLFGLTRDRSIKKDVVELLDLSEGRFFPARTEETALQFSADWKILTRRADLVDPEDGFYNSTSNYAASTIARAQNALGMPVGWVDFSRRAGDVNENANRIYAANVLETLTLLARNIPASRPRRAAQITEVLDSLNGQTPDVHSGYALLDFVAAFENASGE